MHVFAASFLALYLAHLLTDFVFESDRLVVGRRHSAALAYLEHGGIHLFSAALLLGLGNPALMRSLDFYGVIIGLTLVHLGKSRAMVVLISPDSMRSENVRHEIEYALGDPNYEGRVFPVQVRPTEDIPWILRRFKSFDARQSAAKVSESIANALKQPA